jgi:putative transposase
MDMLKTQPIDVDEVSESYTSSINPFNGKKLRKGKQVAEMVIKVFNPYLMTALLTRVGGIKVFKVNARYLESGEVLLDRQLNASLNIYLKMCGFPHIRDIPRVWVGVIPLKGRRGMNGAMPRDSVEAQGLRIGYKFMKIQ